MRLYPKVFRPDNWYNKEDREAGLPLDEVMVIQEKLDGSNVSIVFRLEDEGSEKLVVEAHSRMRQIKREDPGNWASLFEWIDKLCTPKFLKEILACFPPGIGEIRFHGEWLMQAKLPYNETHKNTFWLFDIAVADSEGNTNFLEWDAVKDTAKFFGLNTVPVVKEEITLREFMENDGTGKYVENQKTLLPDSDSKREGVVLKKLDCSDRIKFVSKEFKESMGQAPNKNLPLFVISNDLLPETRVQKFIQKLKEEQLLPLYVDYNDGNNMKIIFQNLQMMIDDFMEEEFESFMKLVKKQVSRTAGRVVKSYIEKQRKLGEEDE